LYVSDPSFEDASKVFHASGMRLLVEMAHHKGSGYVDKKVAFREGTEDRDLGMI